MDRVVKSIFDNYWHDIAPVRHQGLSVDLVGPVIWKTITSLISNISEKKIPNGALLIGPVGTGKTSLIYLTALHIIKTIAENYPRIENFSKEHRDEYFLNTEDDLVNHLISMRWLYNIVNITFFTHWGFIQKLRTTASESGLNYEGYLFDKKNILFLDDLGRGYDDKAGWSLALQDEYFDYRWRHNMPTFITTNLTPDELRSWPGYERIIDRIADPVWMKTIIIAGESKRRKEFYEGKLSCQG